MGQQFDRGRQHVDGSRRQILPQIKSAGRQFELAEVAEAADIGVGLREIEQPDSRRVQHLARGLRRRRIPGQEYGVHLLIEQRGSGRLAFQVEQLGRSCGVDLVGLQQRQRQRARAAAGRPDGDATAAQLRQPRQHRAAVENGERHVEYAAEGDQIAGIAVGRGACLHQRDVHAGFRGQQPLQVVLGSLGREDDELDAVACQDLLVPLGHQVEAAARRTAGDGDRAGRSRTHEMQGCENGDCTEQQQRRERLGEVQPDVGGFAGQHAADERPVFAIALLRGILCHATLPPADRAVRMMYSSIPQPVVM